MVINLFKIIAFFIVFFLIVYIALGWSIRSIVANKCWLDPQFITVAISFTIGFLIALIELKFLTKLDVFYDRMVRALQNARKGNWGEKKTFEQLKQLLGNRYRIVRNFKIPDRKFDIDMIVLGPKGIITFEVKNIGSENDIFRFEGADVYKITRYRNGNECSCKLSEYGNANPIQEAIRHNLALEKWLTKIGYEGIKVKGVVLMVSEARIEFNKPAIFIIKDINHIKQYIDDSFEDPAFTEEFCSKLEQVFKENL